MPVIAEQKALGSQSGTRRAGPLACAHAPVIIALLIAASAAAQTAKDPHGGVAVAPLQHERPAKIVVDPPLAHPLSGGTAVLQYRTENLRIAPLFGPAALSLYPRVGHFHVSVDDADWVWAHASEEPVTVVGLAPGPHSIRIQLMNANHQRLDEGAVRFTVPEAQPPGLPATHMATEVYGAAVQASPDHGPAKIIIDSPLPEPLSRGVVFIRYRAGISNVVSGTRSAALSESQRFGHIHVTVDKAPWHWADASGNPIIIQGLAPGRHRILIDLANANDQVIDRGTVEVTIHARDSKPEAR